ncbi:MAG: T9SS type A sorting domain-containing protein [Flavobacteriales bacterium]|nr:T9SS type A sorting domain-containing protein [Flavobacteriales bacterium]
MKKHLLFVFMISCAFSFAQWSTTSNNTSIDVISAFSKVYSSDGFTNGLFESTDNGNTWTNSNTGVPSAGVEFGVLHNGNLYAYKNNTVFVSTTGNNWTSMTGAFGATDIIKGMTVHSGTVYAATSPLSGGGFKIFTLNGSSWALKSSFTQTIINNIASVNGALFGGTTANGVIKSTDNGQTFTNSSSGMPTQAPHKSVLCFAPVSGGMLAGTYGGKICRSTDNGATWTSVYDIGDNSLFIGINEFYIHSTNEIFAATDSGFVYTLNGGLNWQKSNSGLNYANFEYLMKHVTVSGSYIVAGVNTMVGSKIVRMPLNQIITSIKKNTISLNSKVYPNPSSGLVNFNSNAFTSLENISVNIINVTGKLITSYSISDVNTVIDFSSFENGLYFYEINSEGERIETGKLLIQH